MQGMDVLVWGVLVLGAAVLFMFWGLLVKQRRKLDKLKQQFIAIEKQARFTHKQFIKTQSFFDNTITALSESLAKAGPDWKTSARDLQKALLEVRATRPPCAIPAAMLDEYTMNGRIPVEERYRDSSYSSKDPLVYENEKIDEYIRQIGKGDLKGPRYGVTNEWLFQALKKYGIQGKEVAIMGSNRPWYESMCLFFKAKCTTIEYNRIISNYPNLKIITPAEYDQNPVRFEFALSISSFEHDGLGRFGDPLNPRGDLDAMKKMKSIVKPGGILFLATPVGKDKLYWNAHRVYGQIRLPLLLEGWEIVESFGYNEKDLLSDKNSYEPVFVLRNT